jgi:hypothetical protein
VVLESEGILRARKKCFDVVVRVVLSLRKTSFVAVCGFPVVAQVGDVVPNLSLAKTSILQSFLGERSFCELAVCSPLDWRIGTDF